METPPSQNKLASSELEFLNPFLLVPPSRDAVARWQMQVTAFPTSTEAFQPFTFIFTHIQIPP